MLVAVGAVGCPAAPPQQPCPQFDDAQRALDDMSAAVLDPTFQDPRFVEIAVLFEAVPKACPRAERAAMMADSIRKAQTQRTTATAVQPRTAKRSPAPKTFAPPRPVPPAAVEAAIKPPPPSDKKPTAEDCARLVADARSKCPAACKEKAPEIPEGWCEDACEETLMQLLPRVKCPPVPRRPQQYTPPQQEAKKEAPVANKGSSTNERPDKYTYCAYFVPSGNSRRSYCTAATLADAQRECDETLKKQSIEGTCACTDDASFIGDRCK